MRKKYNLSEEGFKKLMSELEIINKREVEKVVDPEGQPFDEAMVDTGFISKLFGIHSLEQVIKNEEHYNVFYRGFLDMYGFDSMYDMYIYGMSCEIMKADKDYNNLVPVKRTITRNGKQVEVTVWEKPDEDEPSKDEPSHEEAHGHHSSRHAREYKSDIVGKDKKVSTKEVANLKKIADQIAGGKANFDTSSTHYLKIHEDGEVVGIAGYSDVGEYYRLDFVQSNGFVSGVGVRAFFELINLALEDKKGVIVKDVEDQSARGMFASHGLEHEKGEWKADYKTLAKTFGHKND